MNELLTVREREVLALVAQDKTNQEIADALGITYLTARNHVTSILGKLGLDTRTEAADWWRAQQGLPRRLWRPVRAALPLAGLGTGVKLAAGAVGAAIGGFVFGGALLLGLGSVSGSDEAPEALQTVEESPTEAAATTATPIAFFAYSRARSFGLTEEDHAAILEEYATCLAQGGAEITEPPHEGAVEGRRAISYTFTDVMAAVASHDSCGQRDGAPIWNDLMLQTHVVVPDGGLPEEALRLRRSLGFLRIDAAQRAMLADGRVTVDEHATAAEAFFVCARENDAGVFTAEFDPGDREPQYAYTSKPEAEACLEQHYGAVSFAWQHLEDPNFALDRESDALRERDAFEGLVVPLAEDAGGYEIAVEELTSCLTGAGGTVVGPRKSPSEITPFALFAATPAEAEAMLAGCQPGGLDVLRFEVTWFAATPGQSQPSPEPPVQGPLVQVSGIAYEALEDGMVELGEMTTASMLYRVCMEGHGFTVDPDIAEDVLLADPDAGVTYQGTADAAAAEEQRRACAITFLNGTWHVWQAQEAGAG